MRIHPNKSKVWHNHFCWWPVEINCGYPYEHGTIVWMETVRRKWFDACGYPLWHYELPDSTPPEREEIT